jgi:dTDP-4-amino-4,6-dideoxygalactose transaminase
MEYLRQNDIQTLIHYPVSINKQYFTNNVEDSGSFFNSEKLVDELVSLPINPWLSQNELDQIVGCINDFRQ